jgi:hypothetical protein
MPTESTDLGEVVARVGDVPIFSKQVEAEARETSLDFRRALANLIEASLLAEQARQQGYLPPTDVHEVKSAIVQRFIEKELESKLKPEAIPDQTIRPLYDRMKDAFIHPRLVEIGALIIYTGSLMKKESKAERLGFAKELASWVEGHPDLSLDDFAALAMEPHWKERNVVYARVLQGLDKPFSKTVGIAVSKLRKPGDRTLLITDDDGFFLARYIDERQPENITFAEVRQRLISGYFDTWRKEQFLEFTNRLIRDHKIEAHFDRLVKDERGH